MTIATTTHSHLLSLPRELRDIIYTFTLADFPLDFNADSQHVQLSGLLLTNKQLHDETIEFYYKLLTVTVYPYHSGQLLRWLAELPTRYRELISEIRITFSPEGYGTRKLLRLKDRVRKHYLLAETRDMLAKNGTPFNRGVVKMHVCIGDREEDWVWTSEPLGLKWRSGKVIP